MASIFCGARLEIRLDEVLGTAVATVYARSTGVGREHGSADRRGFDDGGPVDARGAGGRDDGKAVVVGVEEYPLDAPHALRGLGPGRIRT
jgi:hypothetical protein